MTKAKKQKKDNPEPRSDIKRQAKKRNKHSQQAPKPKNN